MNSVWLVIGLCLGLLLTGIGGLGVHVLDRFNGRELESYCATRRKRERFGDILDHQEEVIAASHYAHLLGIVLFLPSFSWFAALRLGWLSSGNSQAIPINFPQAVWFVVLTSTAVLLLSLWLPRTVVRVAASPFIFHTWPFWKFLAYLLSPLAAFGELFEILGYRLRDEQRNEDFEEEMLEDEIRTRIAAGQREGLVGEGVSEMIAGVMNLDEADVTSIMTPRSQVDAIDADLPWPEVLSVVSETGRTRFPVYRNSPDNIIGVLFAKDILPLLSGPKTEAAKNLDSILRKPWFVPASKQVDELLRDFLHNRNHMAIVLDEFHQVVGVVTIEDALEQIVGEIADELDEEESNSVRVLDDGDTLEAEGKLTIDRLNKRFGWDLPESDEYDTVAGLVIFQLSRIPEEGARVELGRLTIDVLRATKRQILKIRLHRHGSHKPVGEGVAA